jgi:cytochrome c oxidase accessory protein FixG
VDTIKEESFRDHIATINDEGKRNFIYPKKPKGKLTNQRGIVAAVLLIFIFAVPWLRINGQPFLLLDVLGRKFIILGNVYWPQDFYLLAISALTGVLFVVLFTVVFGRLFCGWMCPQTIFMEHVFRRIEYWFEGDRGQQIRLSKLPWSNPEKLRKKGLKNIVFWLISFIIANDFLMILVGTDHWLEVVKAGPAAHWGNFVAMIVFTSVFYFVFAWFREQVCIIVCPYGRLQGVLLDRKSVVIAYDYNRGEKRGLYKKAEDRNLADKGDCIDCNQCVDVCPTGIDIRNGTQLECINCTACIDACDTMMDKVNLPKGLIRFASEESIAEKVPHKYSTRAKAYTVVLAVLLVITGFMLSRRTILDATILRATGLTYIEKEGKIANLYNFKVINKSAEPQDLEIKLISPKGSIEFVGTPAMHVEVGTLTQGSFFILLDPSALTGAKTDVEIGIFAKGELVETVETNLNGPRTRTKTKVK